MPGSLASSESIRTWNAAGFSPPNLKMATATASRDPRLLVLQRIAQAPATSPRLGTKALKAGADHLANCVASLSWSKSPNNAKASRSFRMCASASRARTRVVQSSLWSRASGRQPRVSLLLPGGRARAWRLAVLLRFLPSRRSSASAGRPSRRDRSAAGESRACNRLRRASIRSPRRPGALTGMRDSCSGARETWPLRRGLSFLVLDVLLLRTGPPPAIGR